MPDSPVISGVADLPKFYFAEGAPFRLTLTIGAEFSMTGKFVTFGMRARSGTVRRVFGTDSGESNLTIAGQVITLNIATNAATVPAFASGWTLEDVQAKGETEYWVDISATEGSDVLLRLQGQADWVAAGSDIAESSAVVSSPAIDVDITSGAVSVSVAVLGAAEPTLTTNTATSGLTGILKAASNTLDVAVAGTDYVAANDSRLTDARTPTSHVHGGISNAGAIGSTSGLPIKTGTSGVLEAGAFGTGSGQFAQGNDSRFHDRSHAITSTSDHTAGNWKVFHSNGSGQLVELALGANDTFLKSNGASAAPSFATPAGGGSSITGTGIAYVRSGGNDTTGTIGNPSLPYLTAQAAWDDGARNLELGGGSYTVTHYSTTPGSVYETVRVLGLGKDASSLTIDWSGTPATEESPAGKTPYDLRLISDHSVAFTVNLSGSNAHSGDNNGGGSPQFDFQHCYFSAFSANGGSGSGSGSSGSVSGGTTKWCEVQSGFGGANAIDFFATLEGTSFKGGLNASNVAYGGSDVDTALDSLTARVAQETYMRTSDFTSSSAVVSNVTGLACSVAANEKLLIEIVGFHAGGASGDGLRICFIGPVSPTHVRYSFSHFTTTAALRTDSPATAFGTDVVDTSGTNVSLPFTVTLTLINGSNPGTIQFKAGAETTTTTSTTISTGCTMRVHRIP
jgi:hypothetical protein